MSDIADPPQLLLALLDDMANSSGDNNAIEEYFTPLGNKFKRVKSRTEYEEYLRIQPTNVEISLITNGRLGQQIVPEIHSSAQIVNIYIFCFDKAAHDKWSKTYDKVRCVVTDFNDLKKILPSVFMLTRSIIKSEKPGETITDLPETTDSPQRTTPQIATTYELDGTFMIADSCFNYLFRIKTCPNEKDDFGSFYRDALQGINELLPLIEEFQSSYSPDQAILWLYKHCIFEAFIENIFKTAYIDAMFPFRILIRDIHKQLVQHKCTSITQAYRSEFMADGQIQQMKNFIGRTIAIKSFILSNSNRTIAVSYTDDISLSNGRKRVMFIIDADPQIENIKPFAKIGGIMNNNDATDVLFMIGSLFKVIEIEDEKDGFINIKLTLCGKDDTNQSIELCNQLHAKYIDQNGETDTIGFGKFLFELGNSMNAKNLCENGEKIIQSLIEKLPENDQDRLRCYDALGSIEFSMKRFDNSLEWYKKSLDLRKSNFPENLAESYMTLASVSLEKGDDEHAFEYFKELSIILKQSDDECYGLIYCYTRMAMIYQKQNNQTQALSCYYRALSIMRKHNCSDDACYATMYSNLGNTYVGLALYQLALGYYNASLEIKQKLYSTSNPGIVALAYKHVACAHESLNNVQQARMNFEKALEFYRQLDPADQSSVAEIEEIIRNLPAVEQNSSNS